MKRSVIGLGAVSLVGMVLFLGVIQGRAQELLPGAGRGVGWQAETPGPRLM